MCVCVCVCVCARKEVSKLVFYAQSTGAVISGREERGSMSEKDTKKG